MSETVFHCACASLVHALDAVGVSLLKEGLTPAMFRMSPLTAKRLWDEIGGECGRWVDSAQRVPVSIVISPGVPDGDVIVVTEEAKDER
jgi:hypothetical protein